MTVIKWLLFAVGWVVIIIAIQALLRTSLGGVLCWVEVIVFPVTAILVVYYSYFMAPQYNDKSAVLGFMVGSVLAYYSVNTWYPECHEQAYQRAYLPLVVTYISGLVTLWHCLYLSWEQR